MCTPQRLQTATGEMEELFTSIAEGEKQKINSGSGLPCILIADCIQRSNPPSYKHP